jgi:hypothetical protein
MLEIYKHQISDIKVEDLPRWKESCKLYLHIYIDELIDV